MMNPYCGRSEAVRELLRGVYSYSFGRAGIDAGPYGALFGGMQVFVRRCVGIRVEAASMPARTFGTNVTTAEGMHPNRQMDA